MRVKGGYGGDQEGIGEGVKEMEVIQRKLGRKGRLWDKEIMGE